MYRTVLGAIIGVCIGLLLRNPWAIGGLLILGAVIGSRLDSHATPHEPDLGALPPEPDELPPPRVNAPAQRLIDAVNIAKTKRRLADDVCALFVALAQADGELIREEVRVARLFFEEDLGYSTLELDGVRVAMKRALSHPIPLDEAAELCCESMMETERVLLINALFEVALADGPLTSEEERLLTRAADALKIPPSDLRTVFEMHLGTGEQHYKTLGVTSEVPNEELKRVYRRLVVLHHPDRVAHLGAAASERATERFRDIQSAWEHVRRVRGL